MSEHDLLSDEELMKDYQKGNEMAFATLYSRHSPRVYGYLLKRLRDKAFADDVFQAVFLKIHQSRKSYDPSLLFGPWLFSVCKSVMIDSLRKRNRTLGMLDDSHSGHIETFAAEAPIPSAAIPSLDDLPEVQRRAVELRYGNDLSFEEIAKQLETTPSNVRQLTSRAVRKLKSWVGSEKERG